MKVGEVKTWSFLNSVVKTNDFTGVFQRCSQVYKDPGAERRDTVLVSFFFPPSELF